MSRLGHGGVGSGGEACIATFLGGDASSPPPPTLVPPGCLDQGLFPQEVYPVIVIVESRSGQVMVGSGREGKVALTPFWAEMPPPTPSHPLPPCRWLS